MVLDPHAQPQCAVGTGDPVGLEPGHSVQSRPEPDQAAGWRSCRVEDVLGRLPGRDVQGQPHIAAQQLAHHGACLLLALDGLVPGRVRGPRDGQCLHLGAPGGVRCQLHHLAPLGHPLDHDLADLGRRVQDRALDGRLDGRRLVTSVLPF